MTIKRTNFATIPFETPTMKEMEEKIDTKIQNSCMNRSNHTIDFPTLTILTIPSMIRQTIHTQNH